MSNIHVAHDGAAWHYYDADNDGAVDTAEGVREVTEFPDNPKKGDIVMKDGQLYVCTEVDD